MTTIYKIKDKKTGLYSHGSVNGYDYPNFKSVSERIKWSRKGKEWTSEKLVKDHLLKCIGYGGIPSSWEIMEFTQQPSRELNEWMDAKMTMAVLKMDHTKK